MVMWKALAFAGMASSAAILAASVAPAGTGTNEAGPGPVAALMQLAQTDPPAADAAAATPAATAEAPAEGAAAPEEAATEEAAAAEEGEDGEEEVAVFTEEFLNDPVHQDAGKVVWETCSGCHGARAYPGKAPKLKPKKYTPDFVFDRVTHGYKKMPAWKDVFTKDERMDVVAYILSHDFSP
jgi:mono/diheme cytochrome c family protein